MYTDNMIHGTDGGGHSGVSMVFADGLVLTVEWR